MTPPVATRDEMLAAETPMADHVKRFWRHLETEHVRICVDLRREIGNGVVYYDGATFSDDTAKALVADRTAATAQVSVTVDSLAQEIRRVDGSNSLGAGALAEALMLFLTKKAE